MGHRLWLPAVAIHRLGVIEIAPSPHHCFCTAHSCAQSVKGSPTETVLSRSSRQRLGHLQSHFDGGWHVCQAVFPEPQPAAACGRVERRDCAHEALPRLQSASSWLVMERLVSGVCRLSCAFHAFTVEACTSRILPYFNICNSTTTFTQIEEDVLLKMQLGAGVVP